VSLRGGKQQRKVEEEGLLDLKLFPSPQSTKQKKKFKVSFDFPFVLLRKIVE
jgi:hypothetical protein